MLTWFINKFSQQDYVEVKKSVKRGWYLIMRVTEFRDAAEQKSREDWSNNTRSHNQSGLGSFLVYPLIFFLLRKATIPFFFFLNSIETDKFQWKISRTAISLFRQGSMNICTWCNDHLRRNWPSDSFWRLNTEWLFWVTFESLLVIQLDRKILKNKRKQLSILSYYFQTLITKWYSYTIISCLLASKKFASSCN